MSDKTQYTTDAPAGAALIAQAMERREGAARYKAMQSIMDWDSSRLAYRAVKRAFDIVFSGAALVAIAIPSLILAAAIRLESEGGPFYSQIRVGQTRPDGSLTTFRMWKFRSMYKDADERLAELKGQNEIAGAMFKMKEDPRVTRIGRFIRKHSIDEFPQFLNVFLGQMSVVGPRPPPACVPTVCACRTLAPTTARPGVGFPSMPRGSMRPVPMAVSGARAGRLRPHGL